MTTNPTGHLGQSPPPRDTGGGFVRQRRFAVNITPIERGGRIVIGLAAVIFAVGLLLTARSALAVVLEILLIAAGLDLVVTGALGHCPLYKRLGHVPASLRGPT